MFDRVTVWGAGCGEAAGVAARAREELLASFPGLALEVVGELPAGAGLPARRVDVCLEALAAPAWDPSRLDWSIDPAAWDEPVWLRLRAPADGRRLASRAWQILTRLQRLLERRNASSRGAGFERALRRHRALHDLELPLVRADYEHAVDTWRWVLRLAPDAGLALQLAALFHDVERLRSEPRARVEQRALDYAAFKRAHARAGAALARDALEEVGLPPKVLAEVRRLVAAHEQPGADEALGILNEADALSFFSLNACGFLDCYGPAHTRRKIAYTLARLGPRGLELVARLRLRDDFAALAGEVSPALAAALDRAHVATPAPGVDGAGEPSLPGGAAPRTWTGPRDRAAGPSAGAA